MRGRSVRRLLVLALLAVLAIAAIWTLVPVKYRAIAQIQISPIIPYVVFQTEDTGLMPLYDSFVNTQVSIIKSPQVLQRALDRPEVQATRWFKEPLPSLMQRLRGDQIPRVERLRNSLVVRPRYKTEITDVVMEDPNPEDARVIVQAVVDEYERYAGTQSDKARDGLYGQLISEYNTLKRSVELCEKTCSDIQEELGTSDPDRLLSNRAIALDETRTALTTVQQDISNLRLQIENAGGADANEIEVGIPVETSPQPKYYTDPEWYKLDRAVKNARHAINTYPFKPSDPNGLKLLQLDLKFAAELLREREEQLDEQWLLTSGLAALATDANSVSPKQRLEFRETQLELLRNQEKNLIVDLRKKQDDYDRLFTIAQRLKRETDTLQHQRGLFAAVQARKDAKDMEKNSLGRISVLAAMASFTPHNDRRALYTGIVLAVCLILVCGIVCRRWKCMNNAARSQ